MDVAQAAGVSKATAAQVCRGEGRISPETRRMVLKVARELDYMPNALAASLSRRRTNIIGFYMNRSFLDLHNEFIVEILSGLEIGCNQHRQDLLLHGTFHCQEPYDIYAELASGKTDGLVLISWSQDPLVKCLVNSHLPVIALTDPIPDLYSVTVDDVAGSRLLAEYLHQKGHHHVLYRQCPFEHLSSTERRYKAFLQAAKERNIAVISVYGVGKGGTLSESQSAKEITAKEFKSLLARPKSERPTAVVCWNDDDAKIFLRQCLHLGIRVPHDLSVVGFDGIAPGLDLHYRLTTIYASWSTVAATAVTLLLNQVAGKEVAPETILPVELLVGNTT